MTILKNHTLSPRALIKSAILVVFLLGNILNFNIGWADNADFYRMAVWCCSNPVGLEAWPPAGTPAWTDRFNTYFLTDWEFNPGLENKAETLSTAMLLWYPGVLLNRYFYSAYTLHMPFLSLGVRAMLFLFLLLVFAWIDRRSAHPILHYITIAFPITLLLITADMAAFYNTFYQENGMIAFLPFLIAVILSGRWVKRRWVYYLVYALALFLVAVSKSSAIYWPVLAIFFVIPIAQFRRRPLWMAGLALVLMLAPVLLSLNLGAVPTMGHGREYNAIFSGVLPLSDAPEQRLAEVGLSDMSKCLHVDWYDRSDPDMDCAWLHKDQLSYFVVLKIMLHEPQIVFRQISLLAGEMQNYSLNLGKYAKGDATVRQEARLNLWSRLKAQVFPRGWLLIGLTPVLMLLAGASIRREGLLGDLALVALLCLSAMWIDGFVEILGDGQRDLLKHLVIPNMLFDYAWIAALNLVVLLGLGWVRKRPAERA